MLILILNESQNCEWLDELEMCSKYMSTDNQRKYKLTACNKMLLHAQCWIDKRTQLLQSGLEQTRNLRAAQCF